MEDYYNIFSEIRRIKIDSHQINKGFGRQAAFRLNYHCPIVVKKGGEHLDVLTADLGFPSDEALYDFIMNYSKYKWEQEMREHYCVDS